ncbi:hypothetical protein R3P38DRAFT_2953401 [Favolaschia claudopus]|uniref:Uncharacterized protein n=1 Tax=Favolaschia claudopus TaxID=2862362 RepID=A0AAW0BGF2_9AGAR
MTRLSDTTSNVEFESGESMRLLRMIYPELGEDQLREILQSALNKMSPDAVENHFRVLLEVANSGAVFGPATPPPGAQLKFFDFDIHRVFYHPLYPPSIPNPGLFSWNFYIGQRGKGVDSIIPNAQQLYDIQLLDAPENWEQCRPLNVLPLTRVRLFRRGFPVQELVFPPNPSDPSSIHYLPA